MAASELGSVNAGGLCFSSGLTIWRHGHYGGCKPTFGSCIRSCCLHRLRQGSVVQVHLRQWESFGAMRRAAVVARRSRCGPRGTRVGAAPVRRWRLPSSARRGALRETWRHSRLSMAGSTHRESLRLSWGERFVGLKIVARRQHLSGIHNPHLARQAVFELRNSRKTFFRCLTMSANGDLQPL